MAIWVGKGRKYQVKVKKMRLVVKGISIEERQGVMGVQIKWHGPSKYGLSSLYRKTHQVNTMEIKTLELVDQDCDHHDDHDDGFVNVCTFSVVSKDPLSFAPWFVSLLILSGESSSYSSSSSREKMQVIGKSELNLGELASKMEAQIEHQIPVTLQLDGVAIKATLKVIVTFDEMKSHSHSRTTSRDLGIGMKPGDSPALLRRAMSQRPSSVVGQEKAKKNKFRLFAKQLSSKNMDDTPTTSNSGSEYVVMASGTKNGAPNSVTELGTSPSSEAQLDLVKKGGFWKWKRRRSKKKIELFGSIPKPAEIKGNVWESRELVSRDGKTKLNASVFLASYDQRDEKAAGESACAVIVAVIAHWLLLNPGAMPTGPELDHLITVGSTEWRKLCKNESHQEFFPDQHFDLETILQAELRPLTVNPGNSQFGFFHSEHFDHLKHMSSFDEIWDDISNSVNHLEPRVYIVRWNDHFFVLKAESNAYHIIDSLGERLHEGCNQAYILRFDDSTVISAKGNEGEEEKVICRGKECCREYMKRFLAALTLREFKEAEEKGETVDAFALCQRLQIDFHLSTPSPSSSAVSTANNSVSASPNTSPALTGKIEHVQKV